MSALGISNLLSITDGPEGMQPERLTLEAVDESFEPIDYIGKRTLQWWPESFSDSYSVGWSDKSVPGTSHAMSQWNGNDGRSFSLEIVLSRILAPDDSFLAVHDQYNVDVKAGIAWLRSFCYPRLPDGGAVRFPKPPPLAALTLPGMGLDESGGDTLICRVDGCNVTYVRLFPNGVPRVATVSMEFKQVVQNSKTGLKVWSAKDLATRGSRYRGP